MALIFARDRAGQEYIHRKNNISLVNLNNYLFTSEKIEENRKIKLSKLIKLNL